MKRAGLQSFAWVVGSFAMATTVWIGSSVAVGGCAAPVAEGEGESAGEGEGEGRASAILELTGDASSGGDVFAAQACDSCHATGTAADISEVDIISVVENDPEDAVNQILNGGSSDAGTMIAYDSLSNQEIADLLAFIPTLDD